MKTFEELTPQEKEKLMIYNIMYSALWVEQAIFMAVSFAFVSIAFPIVMISIYFESIVLLFVGATIAIFGGLLCLVVVGSVTKEKKQRQLAFGIDTQMRDVFQIKPSDIRDMRLVWKKE